MSELKIIGKRPERKIPVYFLLVIFAGAFLLNLPISSHGSNSISFVDALFTSTSAVCVTGLIVVDTSTQFSLFGQIVIMLLIQIGSLGVMTLSSMVLLRFMRSLSLEQEKIIEHSLGIGQMLRGGSLLRAVLMTALLFEGIGTLALFVRFVFDYPVGQAFFHAIFHSVSAFGNAGFSTFSNSLENYSGDPYMTVVFSFLIISGGLGFVVISEIHARLSKQIQRLSLHSKLSITMTILLLVLGTVAFYVGEYHNLSGMGNGGSILMNSFFQSVTARTAGFNMISQSNLTEVSLLITLILMFIGACPGSTGGGVKTTTIATVFLVSWHQLRGSLSVSAFKRSISEDSIKRALTVILLGIFIIMVVFVLLMYSEEKFLPYELTHGWFIKVGFEVVSAFGTVGLSLGLTPELSTIGKLAITVLMFLGRIGLLTLVVSLSGRKRVSEKKYLEEQIMIG